MLINRIITFVRLVVQVPLIRNGREYIKMKLFSEILLQIHTLVASTIKQSDLHQLRSSRLIPARFCLFRRFLDLPLRLLVERDFEIDLFLTFPNVSRSFS